MEEIIFFDSKEIKVTNSRFIVSGKTYALSVVNSFRVDKIDETPMREIYKIYVFILALWALFECLSKNTSFIIISFIVLATVGSIWWGKTGKEKIKYVLLLTTSSGESEAVSSYVPSEVQEIESALSQAIVYRS